MKKATKIIIAVATIFSFQFSVFSFSASAQNSSFLHRTDVGLTFNTLSSVNFNFGSGLLKCHPERSIDLSASFHLWQHLELGGFLSLQGASSTGNSGMYNISIAPNVDYYYLAWDDNKYHLSGGMMVQLHLNSFDKRFQRDNILDIVARGGWGLGGQVDGFWIGFGEEFRISRQVVWTISADYGNFPFATLKQIADDETGWRFSTGLKISLK